jgi:hypothetical protein
MNYQHKMMITENGKLRNHWLEEKKDREEAERVLNLMDAEADLRCEHDLTAEVKDQSNT